MVGLLFCTMVYCGFLFGGCCGCFALVFVLVVWNGWVLLLFECDLGVGLSCLCSFWMMVVGLDLVCFVVASVSCWLVVVVCGMCWVACVVYLLQLIACGYVWCLGCWLC